jgi:hypothetical protein
LFFEQFIEMQSYSFFNLTVPYRYFIMIRETLKKVKLNQELFSVLQTVSFALFNKNNYLKKLFNT